MGDITVIFQFMIMVCHNQKESRGFEMAAMRLLSMLFDFGHKAVPNATEAKEFKISKLNTSYYTRPVTLLKLLCGFVVIHGNIFQAVGNLMHQNGKRKAKKPKLKTGNLVKLKTLNETDILSYSFYLNWSVVTQSLLISSQNLLN